MRTRFMLIILLVVSLGVNIGLLLNYLRVPPAPAAPAAGWNCPMMQGRFKLTPAQAEELEKLRLAMVAKTAEIKQDLELKRQALLDLHRQSAVDDARADSLLMAIALRQFAMEKAVFKHMQEVKNALTPQQREMFYRLLADEICPGLKTECRMNCGEK
jgi:Spy/CpxP family protein refolding chaperone